MYKFCDLATPAFWTMVMHHDGVMDTRGYDSLTGVTVSEAPPPKGLGAGKHQSERACGLVVYNIWKASALVLGTNLNCIKYLTF